MSQSLSEIYVHIIFSTKLREPFLSGPDLRSRTHGYLVGACRNLDSPSLIIGGVEDHVHILCRFSKNWKVSELIRELKRQSSKWVKAQVQHLSHFHWQNGYGVFSISPSNIRPLKQYIANQQEHHRTETFQDELRRMCAKYGVKLDERYAWD